MLSKTWFVSLFLLVGCSESSLTAPDPVQNVVVNCAPNVSYAAGSYDVGFCTLLADGSFVRSQLASALPYTADWESRFQKFATCATMKTFDGQVACYVLLAIQTDTLSE